MNRLNKIQLLKDISTGKKTLNDIQPDKLEVWLKKSGKYYEAYKGLELTKDEFKAHKGKRKNTVMFVPDERFEYE